MKTATIARALVTDDVAGLRVVEVVEVGGLLVEVATREPVDLVSLVVVLGLDELPAA